MRLSDFQQGNPPSETKTKSSDKMKIETKYAIVTETAFDRAMQIARGCYQRSLVMGREALSGATLKGKAKKYGAHYARSRDNFLARLRAAKVSVSEQIADHNRRVLVLA